MNAYHSIFDSHAHYTDEAFSDDRDLMLDSFPTAGIAHVMLAASDLQSAEAGIALARNYPFCVAAVGIHPENAAQLPHDYCASLRQLAADPVVHAIGEIGLDYHYEGYDRDAQCDLFRQQLLLAADLQLPVIIHSRDATADCMEILRELRPRGVMHCFSGSAETARELLALGFYIGFTGVVTFKNARKALEALQVIPDDRLLIETDCPYMAPVPFRGKRCDSRLLPYTAERIAQARGVSTQEILSLTCRNAMRLFDMA